MKIEEELCNSVICGDALEVMKGIQDESIHLVVTSPPYWDVVDYNNDKQIGQSSYGKYLLDLLNVWRETERVLIPNGKLAIVTPIMPIPKKKISNQHTRHLKNINNDIEYAILNSDMNMNRYSTFIWQKQTSEKMFGSYPYPPNIYEDNTIEFINVFVKDGVPRKIKKEVKENSKLTQEEWLNLTMQVWPIYPEDVMRVDGHPAPFPLVLPGRLIKMYTFKKCLDFGFEGDIILDMFVGLGTTCIAAKMLGRRYIGVDINPDFVDIARIRLESISEQEIPIFLERVRVRKAKEDYQLELFKKQKKESAKLF